MRQIYHYMYKPG